MLDALIDLITHRNLDDMLLIEDSLIDYEDDFAHEPNPMRAYCPTDGIEAFTDTSRLTLETYLDDCIPF